MKGIFGGFIIDGVEYSPDKVPPEIIEMIKRGLKAIDTSAIGLAQMDTQTNKKGHFEAAQHKKHNSLLYIEKGSE
jgi:hypothetical protein